MNQPSLFDAPTGLQRIAAAHRQLRGREIHEQAAKLREYAELAIGDSTDSLLDLCERAANAILDCQGSVTVWEVRVALGQIGKLANDGTERLDGLGTLLSSRMRLVFVDRERPPAWVADHLPKSHLNVNSRYRRPSSAAERAARVAPKRQRPRAA